MQMLVPRLSMRRCACQPFAGKFAKQQCAVAIHIHDFWRGTTAATAATVVATTADKDANVCCSAAAIVTRTNATTAATDDCN